MFLSVQRFVSIVRMLIDVNRVLGPPLRLFCSIVIALHRREWNALNSMRVDFIPYDTGIDASQQERITWTNTKNLFPLMPLRITPCT